MKFRAVNISKAILATLLFLAGANIHAADDITEPPLAVIPIEILNNRVLIEAKIGEHQVSLTLDTGASNSALFQSKTRQFADLLVAGSSNIIFPALDEIVEGVNLIPTPIDFGHYSYMPERLLRVDRRPPVGDRLNFKFDGVLGQDFFQKFVVEINREDLSLTLYAPGTDLSKYFRRKMSLHMKGSAPHIKFFNKMPWEQQTYEKELMLDTGYPGAMVIWGDRHFKRAARGNDVKKLRQTNTGIFTAIDFKVGVLRFYRTPVFVAPKEPVQAQKRDGIIGSNILIWFHHVIDFPGERLLLDIGKVHFNRMEHGYFLPNNEGYIVKRFNADAFAGSMFVLENE